LGERRQIEDAVVLEKELRLDRAVAAAQRELPLLSERDAPLPRDGVLERDCPHQPLIRQRNIR
jgi:hypothetical protein